MVLGGGDGSKPSVSFLNFEPKVSKFPPTKTSSVLVFSPQRPLSYFGSLSLTMTIFVSVNLLWPCFRYLFGRRVLLFFVGRVLGRWFLGLL